MAKLEFKMPEEFMKQVTQLGKDTDEVMETVLNAGGKVVAKSYRASLKSVIGNGTKQQSRSTGELLASVGVSPVMTENNGNLNVKIGFNEPRRKQSAAKGKRSYYTATNAMIANVLEYGKSGQPPKPFAKKAKSKSRKECISVMQETLESELKKRL